MNDSIAKKQCSKASGGGRKSGGTVDKTYSIVASTPVKNSQSSGAFAKKPPVVALVKKSPSGVKKNNSLSSAAVGVVPHLPQQVLEQRANQDQR